MRAATIGPDLTGSNRANLEYLLSNVLNPNGEVQDDYKMVLVTTRDGRTFSGNVIAENDGRSRCASSVATTPSSASRTSSRAK